MILVIPATNVTEDVRIITARDVTLLVTDVTTQGRIVQQRAGPTVSRATEAIPVTTVLAAAVTVRQGKTPAPLVTGLILALTLALLPAILAVIRALPVITRLPVQLFVIRATQTRGAVRLLVQDIVHRVKTLVLLVTGLIHPALPVFLLLIAYVQIVTVLVMDIALADLTVMGLVIRVIVVMGQLFMGMFVLPVIPVLFAMATVRPPAMDVILLVMVVVTVDVIQAVQLMTVLALGIVTLV